MGMTAAELMAKLQLDKKYLEQKRIKDVELKKLDSMFREEEKDMLSELRKQGYELGSIWDFVNSNSNYMNAVPTLVKNLQKKYHPRILDGIARSLALSELSVDDGLWDLLVKLYEETPSDSTIDVPIERGAQQGIAVALDALATPARADVLRRLISNYPEGDGVIFFKKKLERFGLA